MQTNQVEIYVDVEDPESVVVAPVDDLYVGESYRRQCCTILQAQCDDRSKRN